MKTDFLPKNILGKWSLGLIVAMLVLFFLGPSLSNLFYQSVPAGKTILEDIFKRPALALPMVLAMLCGILAFISGLFAIIKKKERALLVYLSTTIGAFLIFFLFGELFSLH